MNIIFQENFIKLLNKTFFYLQMKKFEIRIKFIINEI